MLFLFQNNDVLKPFLRITVSVVCRCPGVRDTMNCQMPDTQDSSFMRCPLFAPGDARGQNWLAYKLYSMHHFSTRKNIRLVSVSEKHFFELTNSSKPTPPPLKSQMVFRFGLLPIQAKGLNASVPTPKGCNVLDYSWSNNRLKFPTVTVF